MVPRTRRSKTISQFFFSYGYVFSTSCSGGQNPLLKPLWRHEIKILSIFQGILFSSSPPQCLVWCYQYLGLVLGILYARRRSGPTMERASPDTPDTVPIASTSAATQPQAHITLYPLKGWRSGTDNGCSGCRPVERTAECEEHKHTQLLAPIGLLHPTAVGTKHVGLEPALRGFCALRH